VRPPGQACWFAPGRVNLIGDHTDYQLGWVLPFAIAQGTTVKVEVNDTSRLDVRSSLFGSATSKRIDALAPNSDAWSAYVEGAVATLRADGVVIDGARVWIDGNLPVGAGLASSASLTCATLAALLAAAGLEVEPTPIARLGQRVENEFVQSPVGYMDPAAVMFGSSGHALLIDTRAQQVQAIALPTMSVGLALLLFDTGQRHSTSSAAYAERVNECRVAAAALSVTSLREVSDIGSLELLVDDVVQRRARHVVSENERVLAVAELLGLGRPRDIGPVLYDSHSSLRDDYEVSTPQLDLIVEEAMQAGALGARLTGAGFGGSALVLLDRKDITQVTKQVFAAFERAWGQAPTVREVSPSAGASPQPL